MPMTAKKPKALPGRRSVCRDCRSEIRWAVTVAGANGRGGRAMPLDPIPDEKGNCAVRVGVGGRLYVRVLGKGESHDHIAELLCMPHHATCLKAETSDLVAGVEQLLEHAATRSGEEPRR